MHPTAPSVPPCVPFYRAVPVHVCAAPSRAGEYRARRCRLHAPPRAKPTAPARARPPAPRVTGGGARESRGIDARAPQSILPVIAGGLSARIAAPD